MFWASLCPSSVAYQLQQQPLVYSRNVVVAVLLVVVGPVAQPDRPRPTALLQPRSYGKPEAAAAVDRLLMMGIRMPKTCWAVSRRQTINLLLIAASSWLIHWNVWRYTDLQTIITINWFLRNVFTCSCYATSKWKIIFERLIRKDVKGKVCAPIFRHLDRRKEITRHNSTHNFLRLGIRTRDHLNSRYEHKLYAYLTFIALFVD
jgi:hypothetical protein